MPPRIVIADDDPRLADMIGTALDGEGYKVVIGYDGQMAMQLLIQHVPDLAILDVNMPMYSGIKILESIRSNPKLSQIPVIFLSGASSDFVYKAVDAHQRVAFQKKPLDLIELISLVRHTLEKYPPRDD
jgi:DNA-binding response OmpR family regulator